MSWWDMWEMQKVEVAAPSDKIEKLLNLLGYTKDRHLEEWIGDVRADDVVEKPLNTIVFWREPYYDNGGNNNWPKLSELQMVETINALSPGTWTLVASEDCTDSVGQYMREELIYSPSKGRLYEAAVCFCYGDSSVFGDDYDGFDIEKAGTKRRSRKYTPKQLDEDTKNIIASYIGTEEFENLFG